MKFMGGKSRLAKEILPIMLKDRKPNQWYIEPFCGGCNVIDKVDGKRLANDNNKYLMALWKGLQSDRLGPLKISKEYYNRVYREFKSGVLMEFDNFTIGWVGFLASYNGKFFGGYSGVFHGDGFVRDYISESIRNITKQIENIRGINLVFGDYADLILPANSIVYCDIPYQNTTKYPTAKFFDYDIFWNWVRAKSTWGRKIFVSEYNAPPDFVCIWEKAVPVTMATKGKKSNIERLFKLG